MAWSVAKINVLNSEKNNQCWISRMDGWKIQNKDRLDYGTVKSSRSSSQSNYMDIEYRIKYNGKRENRIIN